MWPSMADESERGRFCEFDRSASKRQVFTTCGSSAHFCGSRIVSSRAVDWYPDHPLTPTGRVPSRCPLAAGGPCPRLKPLSGPHAGKVFTLGCSSGEGFDDEGKYFNTVWHWVDLISDFDFYTQVLRHGQRTSSRGLGRSGRAHAAASPGLC